MDIDSGGGWSGDARHNQSASACWLIEGSPPASARRGQGPHEPCLVVTAIRLTMRAISARRRWVTSRTTA